MRKIQAVRSLLQPVRRWRWTLVVALAGAITTALGSATVALAQNRATQARATVVAASWSTHNTRGGSTSTTISPAPTRTSHPTTTTTAPNHPSTTTTSPSRTSGTTTTTGGSTSGGSGGSGSGNSGGGGSNPGPVNFLEGTYVGPANPSGVGAFATATRTKPTIASEYLPASSGWDGMDGANSSLQWMLQQGWSPSGYTLSLGVPMIPTDANNNPVGSLAQGATGVYNNYFVTLAQTLIQGGEANAYLRLGWEFDGNWYAWYAGSAGDEANYAKYFAQIVTAMRSVPGEAFKFVWNPDASAFVTPGYSVAAAYPGNAYVNIIGLDVYDQSWATPQTPANAWSSTTQPALSAAAHFAASVGKPLAVCEWGVTIRTDGHGLGDDPLYVNNMISWMRTSGVAYESYFDYNTIPSGGDTNAEITGGSFPNSLSAFITDLG